MLTGSATLKWHSRYDWHMAKMTDKVFVDFFFFLISAEKKFPWKTKISAKKKNYGVPS
jgi:hypothetical protein